MSFLGEASSHPDAFFCDVRDADPCPVDGCTGVMDFIQDGEEWRLECCKDPGHGRLATASEVEAIVNLLVHLGQVDPPPLF